MNADAEKRQSSGSLKIPRRIIPLYWAAMVLVIQVLLPWLVGQIGPRFGWAIFFGSPAVLAAFVLLSGLFALRVVPREERQLEALFGDEYRHYRQLVRRWL